MVHLLKQKKRFTINGKRKKNKLRLMIKNSMYYYFSVPNQRKSESHRAPIPGQGPKDLHSHDTFSAPLATLNSKVSHSVATLWAQPKPLRLKTTWTAHAPGLCRQCVNNAGSVQATAGSLKTSAQTPILKAGIEHVKHRLKENVVQESKQARESEWPTKKQKYSYHQPKITCESQSEKLSRRRQQTRPQDPSCRVKIEDHLGAYTKKGSPIKKLLVRRGRLPTNSLESGGLGRRNYRTGSETLFKTPNPNSRHKIPILKSAPIARKHQNCQYQQKPVLGASSVVGFKKQLFHQVMARGHMLYPAFNRRKHKHSYSMVVNNHHVKLSKAFSYLSKNRIAFYIGFALKAANRSILVPPHKKTTRKRAIPYQVSAVESDTALLLLRCQGQFFLRKSRQSINHSWWKPRAQRFLIFGDTSQRLRGPFIAKGRTKQCRWISCGGVLRML